MEPFTGIQFGDASAIVDGIKDAANYIGDTFFGGKHETNDVNKSIAQMNIDFQRETNEKNEALLRESWAREDNAVQRRIADLKAAGLSPTLAAGSAAASSAPIQLKAPRNEFQFENPYGSGILNSIAQVTAIKNQNLQNKLLEKQIETYGEPAWFKALNAILDKFGSGSGPVTNVVETIAKNLGFIGPVSFTPKFGFTFATPPAATKAASTAIGRSAAAHGATFDESTMTLQFHDVKDAKQWYIDIGGTSYEWYYGVASYDNDPSKFIQHIIEDGYITRDGDVYLDR